MLRAKKQAQKTGSASRVLACMGFPFSPSLVLFWLARKTEKRRALDSVVNRLFLLDFPLLSLKWHLLVLA